MAFFLLNILDHARTTCFVFANSFVNSFQSLFANSQRYMDKILRSIFKIWNFLPLFQMLFLWLKKLPLNEILLLVFKRVLDINFEEGIPIWNYIKNNIPIEKSFLNPNLKDYIFEIGDGAVLLLGANTFSPLAWIAKNGYLRVKSKPFLRSLPLWQTIYGWRLYQIGELAEYRQEVDNTNGVEWKRCLCRILHFPFNLRLNTWDAHENILVLALAQ
jgi:hypothetical protein